MNTKAIKIKLIENLTLPHAAQNVNMTALGIQLHFPFLYWH